MHHVVVERWSRGASAIHRRDPRAKVVALLAFLVVVATAHRGLAVLAVALVAILGVALVAAGLPLAGGLLRAAIVLPFAVVFAAVCWIAGDPGRGIALMLKSYLSALAVLLTVSTTPLPLLLRGLESMRVPRFLLMVAQFLYRYLFVISEEAQHMAKAALSRGASAGRLTRSPGRFRAAAGALAVLFARSYGRAEDIHRAMLARGFAGQFRAAAALRFSAADAAFALVASFVPLLLRLALERAA